MSIFDKFRHHQPDSSTAPTQPDSGQTDADRLAAAREMNMAPMKEAAERRLGFLAQQAASGEVAVSQTAYQNSGEVPVITPGMTPPTEQPAGPVEPIANRSADRAVSSGDQSQLSGV